MLYAKRRNSCYAQSVAQGLVVWQLYKKQVGLCTVIASFCFYRESFFRRRLSDNSAPKLNNQDGQADYKERRLKGSENILIKGWGGGSWFWLRQVSSGTGDGVTNASKSILSLGRSVFFSISTEKIFNMSLEKNGQGCFEEDGLGCLGGVGQGCFEGVGRQLDPGHRPGGRFRRREKRAPALLVERTSSAVPALR